MNEPCIWSGTLLGSHVHLSGCHGYLINMAAVRWINIRDFQHRLRWGALSVCGPKCDLLVSAMHERNGLVPKKHNTRQTHRSG